MLIDELEEEAPLWLMTPEEVEAAFTPEAEQLLWARPQGVFGAPASPMERTVTKATQAPSKVDRTIKKTLDARMDPVTKVNKVH